MQTVFLVWTIDEHLRSTLWHIFEEKEDAAAFIREKQHIAREFFGVTLYISERRVVPAGRMAPNDGLGGLVYGTRR